MELIRNEKGLFMYENGEEIGKAICQYSEDTVDIMHVIVKPSMRGNGLAAILVEHVVNEAKEENKEIIPTCSYARAWLKEHEETK